MSNISCNVIRDLLPSYMDGIASKDSVTLIEEHLAECAECRDFKCRLGKPDLHVMQEADGLDYMKKIRRLADLKSAVCFLLVLVTGVFFLGYTKDLYRAKPFFILVAVMLLCNYLLFFHNGVMEAEKRARAIVVNGISVFLTMYVMLVLQLSIDNWINDRRALFGMDYENLGPFLHNQLLLVMVVEMVIWVRELVLHIRNAHFSIVSSSFGIIGFYMSLYYLRMFETIGTLDEFHVISSNALLLFAEGVVILLLILLVERVKRKKEKCI